MLYSVAYTHSGWLGHIQIYDITANDKKNVVIASNKNGNTSAWLQALTVFCPEICTHYKIICGRLVVPFNR